LGERTLCGHFVNVGVKAKRLGGEAKRSLRRLLLMGTRPDQLLRLNANGE
jgi:hypothetical protein